MSRLEELLQSDISPKSEVNADKVDTFFAQYGLEQNPFPLSRTIMPEILYNQDNALQKLVPFTRDLLLSKTPVHRALAVLAGTGGGKTHFLRYCKQNLAKVFQSQNRYFVLVEVQATAAKMQDVVREILRSADETVIQAGATNLATTIIVKLSQQPEKQKVITQSDLKYALKRLLEANKPNYIPQDRDKRYNFELLINTFRHWLYGSTLTETERKYLEVSSRISTVSMAVRILREVLTLARQLGIIEGVLLFVDEMETLFSSGLTPPRYQSFLQDLRFLYDEAVINEVGFSLLLLSASTQKGTQDLSNVNYPVYQRLGFEEQNRVELQPISGVVETRNFAYTYIDYFHKVWVQKFKAEEKQMQAHSLLSEHEIEKIYDDTTGAFKGDVSQARLLDALYKQVEKKRQAFIDKCNSQN